MTSIAKFAAAACALAAIGAGAAGAAIFDAGRTAFGFTAGTSGLEPTASLKLSERVALRGTYASLGYERSEIDGDLAYRGKLDMKAAGLFMDWKPLGKGLTLTGGAYVGDRKVKLDAGAARPIDVGGVTYQPEELGGVRGEIDLGDVAPYVGIGWDTTFDAERRIGFRASVGAAFGKAELSTRTIDGVVARPASLDAEIAEEVARIADEAEALKTYPVVSLGLTYRF